METRKKVADVMGSDSDWPVVKAACAELKKLDIPYEAHILSAHRTPAEAAAFAKAARANGFGAIICAAGMAAHLAGAFAPPALKIDPAYEAGQPPEARAGTFVPPMERLCKGV